MYSLNELTSSFSSKNNATIEVSSSDKSVKQWTLYTPPRKIMGKREGCLTLHNERNVPCKLVVYLINSASCSFVLTNR